MVMTREVAIEELKILKEDYWDDDGYGHETKQYDDTMLALDMAIKALEQEPKRGRWMKSNIGGAKVCSVCNAHMGLSSFKFCPNCGAKMVEPQESEDKE